MISAIRKEYYRENATPLQVGLMASSRKVDVRSSPNIGVGLLHTHQQAPDWAVHKLFLLQVEHLSLSEDYLL